MSTHPKLKVTFALADLHGGGAQRVVLRLLEEIDRRRFEPSLLVLENAGAFRERLPADVPLLDCGRYAVGGRVAWFRTLLGILRTEPVDILVSFLWFTNATCLVARWLSAGKPPLIASERVSVLGAREGLPDNLARALAIRFLYRRADGLLTNSERMADQLAQASKVARDAIVAIPNPFDIERIRTLAGQDCAPRRDDLPIVVGMGRLVPQKGFDLAVRALAESPQPFRLKLIGEGPEAPRLAALARRLGVSERLEFLGFLDNPFAEIAQADLFVLPSRFEGFPNALVEAMALGVAPIAARCPTGPDEIIHDGESGLLVPVEDAAALAGAIAILLREPARRAQLGAAAARRAEDFDVHRIVRRFEAFFEKVAG